MEVLIKERERGFSYALSLHPEHKSNNMLDILDLVTPSRLQNSAGILTCCPLASAFAITLGPTNPQLIVIAEETLDFRRQWISHCLWLLVPTFSLPCAPQSLAGTASLHMKCSATAHADKSAHTRNFGTTLSPEYLRRKVSRRVSCYALFKGWLLLSQPPRCLRNLTAFST